MSTDPSYGGTFHYVDSRWRLDVHLGFNEGSIPNREVWLNKIGYRIYEVEAKTPVELGSPDGKMTLVSTTDTFSDTTYVVIVQGYDGWPRTTMVNSQQYFIQAGLKASPDTPVDRLGTFSLRFQDTETVYEASRLELCHTRVPVTETGTNTEYAVENPQGDPHRVVANGLTALGYYVLMAKS
jgi:hypothetical protein